MSAIEHPDHYNSHPSKIECWDLNGQLNGNLAAAFKYIFRRAEKATEAENINKAIQYLRKEDSEVHADNRNKNPVRFAVQPGRAQEFRGNLELVMNYEPNPSIHRAYYQFTLLIEAANTAQQSLAILRIIGALNEYLKDHLNEAQA